MINERYLYKTRQHSIGREKMSDYIAILYFSEEAYLLDREAYYLLCNLQEKRMTRDPYELIYQKILDWLVENKRAIKLANKPITLVIPHFNQWASE
jgi:hypothetical protein